MMTIRELRYLTALAQYQHFGKAAEACFVSQPALSMQIRKLEETLGVTLIERTNKFFLLTDVGKQLAEQARLILRQVDELQSIADSAKDPYQGELKLGIFPTLAPYLLPFIMPAIADAFPKLSIFLVEEKTDNLLNQLEQGDLQAALVALPIRENHWQTIYLFDEAFHLAVSEKHALATRKKVTPRDLNNQPLLLLDEGHCLRQQALTVCHRLNAHERHDFRATSLETLRHMVAANVGMTLMPTLACLPHPAIRYLPFTNPTPTRSIALVSRASNTQTTRLNALARVIKDSVQDMNIQPVSKRQIQAI